MTGGAAGFVGASSAFGTVGTTTPGRVVAHGVVGGAASEVSGGSFKSGFVSSAFTKSVSSRIEGMTENNPLAGGIAASVVGGTPSVLSGGKFSNAAMTFGFLRLFGEVANYAGRQTDRLKQLTCNSGGKPCEFDDRGVLRTDGGRDIDWSRNPDKSGNWLTRSGMALEGDPHIYENNAIARNFVVDVSKIHDWFNSVNYNPATGFYMSRGVAFDSVFQAYSFVGMPVAGIATVLGYAGNAPLEQQVRIFNMPGDY